MTVPIFDGGVFMTTGMNEDLQPIVERTEMESGVAKQRPMQSSAYIKRPVRVLFTSAEYTAFRTWFKTTCRYGSQDFNWTDPRTETSKNVRIWGGAFKATPVNERLTHYYVDMDFEETY